ncbi:hypothetical protein GCM10007919_61540 [Rhizobium indigoferae]|nr:hypothetical protein GCM10007919_61540 [Rhizobium indigoferae]
MDCVGEFAVGAMMDDGVERARLKPNILSSWRTMARCGKRMSPNAPFISGSVGRCRERAARGTSTSFVAAFGNRDHLLAGEERVVTGRERIGGNNCGAFRW